MLWPVRSRMEKNSLAMSDMSSRRGDLTRARVDSEAKMLDLHFNINTSVFSEAPDID